MQALSFAVHIPLVCFGIAFPAMVLFVEWLYLRTRRSALPDAGAPLVEGDDRAVRRGRRDGDDPQLRDGSAVARVHGPLRRRLRARLRARGVLVLRRGDLHRDLRLRLGPALAAHALPVRHPGRGRRPHGLADGDLGERVDEPPAGLRVARRAGGRRRPLACAVREPPPVARAHAHVHRRLHRRRVARGWCLRLALVARRAQSLRAYRARHPADDRGARRAGSGGGGRLDRTPRGRGPAAQARRLRGTGRDDRRRSSPLGGWYDDGEVRWGIEIPRLLSLLAHHDPRPRCRASSGRLPRTAPGERRARRLSGHGRDRVRARGTRPLASDLAGGVGGGCLHALVLPRGRRRRRRFRWWR